MTYLVRENRNAGMIEDPSFVETTLFAGTKEECIAFEDEQRKEYRKEFGDDFGAIVDCYTLSAEEQKKVDDSIEFWDSLTDEQRNEKIIIAGKTYNKALYERNNK